MPCQVYSTDYPLPDGRPCVGGYCQNVGSLLKNVGSLPKNVDSLLKNVGTLFTMAACVGGEFRM